MFLLNHIVKHTLITYNNNLVILTEIVFFIRRISFNCIIYAYIGEKQSFKIGKLVQHPIDTQVRPAFKRWTS